MLGPSVRNTVLLGPSTSTAYFFVRYRRSSRTFARRYLPDVECSPQEADLTIALVWLAACRMLDAALQLRVRR